MIRDFDLKLRWSSRIQSGSYPAVADPDALMTLVLVVWIKEKHPSAKYLLIVSKASRYLQSEAVVLEDHYDAIKAQLKL